MIGLERFGGDVWKQEPERRVNEVEGRGRPKLEVLGS